jgi:hypothetical protein
MTDANDFMADYERQKAALRAALDTNKEPLFDALAAANGRGDTVELPAGSVPFQQAQSGDDAPAVTSRTLRDAIEALCYDCLALVHDGWENNDGAYGTFTFNVAVRTIELEFNGRFTDVATSTHCF